MNDKPFIKEEEIAYIKQMLTPDWDRDHSPEAIASVARRALEVIEAQENRIGTLKHSNDYLHDLNKKLKKDNKKLFQKLTTRNFLSAKQPKSTKL